MSKATQAAINRLDARRESSAAKPRRSPQKTYNAPRSSPGIPIRDPAMKDYFSLSDPTYAGIRVDENKAMNLAGVYRSVGIIAGLMGSMSIKPYKDDDEDRIEANHPSKRILEISPDGIISSMAWRETMTAHALLRGNGYSELVRNTRGQGLTAHLLDPRQVSVVWEDNIPYYHVMRAKGPPDVLDRSQMIHIAALSWDGFEGKSPVTLARESFATALAAERYGATFFGNSARPLGFLKKATNLTHTQREHLRQEWSEMHEGPENYWKIGVLSGGLEWENIGISPKDAEFLGTRQFQLREIARWFGVPPHMLGDADKTSYNNPEHMMIEFLTLTMLRWTKRWESELRMKLFTRVEQLSYYSEFNMNSLVRADTITQTEADRSEIQNGVSTVNEVRRRHNKPGFGEIGDKPLIMASQLATLEQAASGELMNLRMGGSTNNDSGTGGAKTPAKKKKPKPEDDE